MSLSSVYQQYLRAGAPPHRIAELVKALPERGYEIEAGMLSAGGWHEVSTGSWRARPIYVGRAPPPQAEVGTLWLDTVELTAMVLLELPSYREGRPPIRRYLSLRPVMGWQFHAFLTCAKFVERHLQLQPKRPAFANTSVSPELAPITGLLHGECVMYANWFGKGILPHAGWRDAEACLGAVMDDLWHESLPREWAGYSGWSEEHRVVLARDTWRIDPWDAHRRLEYDEEEDRPGMLALDGDHFADVGFRTACAAPPAPLATEPVLLDAMEPVPVTCESVYAR